MKKKMKRYDGEDGSVVETDTDQGQNKSISDDVRSRAMAAMANRDMDVGGGGSTGSAPAKTTPKAAPKAETKPEPKKEAAPTKQQKAGPTMIRGAKNTGMDLKSALFGSSSDSPRMKAAKRDRAMDASNYSMKSGGKVGSASKRADGIASKGKTKGKWC